MKLTEHRVWSRSTLFFFRASTLTQHILRNTRSSQTYNRSIRCSSVRGTSLNCNFPPETGRVRSYKWFCSTVLFSTVHTFNFYRPVLTLVLVAHHSIPFCLNFVAVRVDSVGKCCGANLGSNLARPFGHSSPKTRKSTIMYHKTIEKITYCALLFWAHSTPHHPREFKIHMFLLCLSAWDVRFMLLRVCWETFYAYQSVPKT